MAGFWLLEVTSLPHHPHAELHRFPEPHVPLDLLHPALADFLKMLPFQYLAYFPAMIFLGKIQGQELAIRTGDRVRVGSRVVPDVALSLPRRLADATPTAGDPM
ncbi:MAG: hypothetical protein U0744_12025 [Gemmataceae bacterium]